MKKQHLNNCPVCDSELHIVKYSCPLCQTSVEGDFKLTGLASLRSEQLDFVMTFIMAEGNIKEVERVLNISYPTVKARLKDIKSALQPQESDEELMLLLEGIEEGDLSVEDALAQIEKRR
ncbi:MAG: DUF2089 family protein [Candidatus Zophobacter franzmannii]|nr:DUF2089 family protein [Candidatus Zophobacter franzmannii]